MDDIKLLNLLKNNPKISNVDLADILNESEENIVKATKELENKKIICGYHTVINWDKTNSDHCSAIIEVSSKPERNKGYDEVASRIAKYPEVTNLYLMSGKSEFMVFIDGKTMKEIADFVGEKLAPIEGITQTVTCFILKKYKVEGILLDEESKDERMIVTA